MRRIDEPWIRSPATQRVFSALASVSHTGYFVGGCVRDAVLGRPVTDLDIATDATPDVAQKACEVAGLRVVPTGVDHGTITIISRSKHFELTTFRTDVKTDGRHAKVAFSTDMADDAARRDFTMNALYADHVGQVIDPLGGLPDLLAGRVRFIGNAQDRIQEDYLRILRYFRFFAWYADPAAGADEDALDAIARHGDGLRMLSSERVTSELLKLLSAPDPAPAIAHMDQAGILHRVLPGSSARSLAPLIHLEQGRAGNPIRRLAVLGLDVITEHLRLSRAQNRELATMRMLCASDENPAMTAYDLGAEMAMDAQLLRAALTEQPLPVGVGPKIARAAVMEFPIKAADLLPEFTGPALGQKLRDLEEAWVQSDFRMSRQDLLDL